MILKKYYVKDAHDLSFNKTGYFYWNENGFYKTLQRRIFAFLCEKYGDNKINKNKNNNNTNNIVNNMNVNLGPTLFMDFMNYMILLLWCISFFKMSYHQSYLWSISSGVLLHMIIGIGHNLFHQKDSYLMKVFDLSMFSSYDWRISHAWSHHIYTNTELDLEISGVEPFLYYLANKRKNIRFLVVGTFYCLGIFVPIIEYTKTIGYTIYDALFFNENDNNNNNNNNNNKRMKRKFRMEYILPPLELFIIYIFNNNSNNNNNDNSSFGKAWCLFHIMHAISNTLVILTTFPLHRSSYAYTTGKADPKLDFGEHIIATTSDHNLDLSLLLSMAMFGLFNNHTLHHLFPTIDESKLNDKDLHMIFQGTCHDFNIPYHEYTFKDLFQNHIRNLIFRGTRRDPDFNFNNNNSKMKTQ